MSDKKKRHHRQIDPIFKQVLTEEMLAFTAAMQTEVEVSRLPRTIDALITIAADGERQRICAETPFFYFLKTNQIEFKGRRDRLTVAGYHLIQGRTHLLFSEQRLVPAEMTVTIVSASKPQAVLAYADKVFRQPFTEIAPGYYQRAGQPVVYLIVVNELPILPKNYPLLLFAASEHKFREFLAQVVATGSATYLRYAYEVRPQVTREVLTMAGISATLSREDLEFMAGDIGPELVPFLKPADVFKGMDAEKQQQLIAVIAEDIDAELVKGVEPDKQMRLFRTTLEALLKSMGWEKLMAEMSPESRKQLLEFLLKLQAYNPIGRPASEH